MNLNIIPKGESVEEKFLRENPGYEIYYTPSISRIGGYDIRISKGIYHFQHFIGFNDIISKTTEDQKNMFKKIFDLGKYRIEEMIAEKERRTTMVKRELRIEISIPYAIPEWDTAEVIRDLQNVAKVHLINPNIHVTDEVVDDTPYKMLCPHCDKVISGIIFSRDKEET